MLRYEDIVRVEKENAKLKENLREHKENMAKLLDERVGNLEKILGNRLDVVEKVSKENHGKLEDQE